MKSAVFLGGTVAWAVCAALVFAQDPQPAPPAPPPASAPAAPQAQPANDNVMFLEKARVEHKDGRITIVYQMGLVSPPGAPGQPPQSVAASIRPLIEPFKSPQGWIYENQLLNLLVITDVKENAEKMAELLRAALTPEPQVRIEAQVIEVRWTRQFQFGFLGDAAGSALWLKSPSTNYFFQEVRMNFRPSDALGPPPFIGSGFKFNSVDDHAGTFTGVLEAFVERGRAEIRSNPTVWVKSGQEAEIQSGDEVPYPQTQILPGGVAHTTITFKATGVTLKVRPQVVSKDFVTLDINQTVSAILGREPIVNAAGVGTIFAPSFSTRSVRTTLTVRSGEEIAIGGLIRKESTLVRRGLPFLMDIPLLGFLFGRTEDEEFNTEIIFVIKPVVFPSGRELPRGLFEPQKK
jgi:general secretion pathway protein D